MWIHVALSNQSNLKYNVQLSWSLWYNYKPFSFSSINSSSHPHLIIPNYINNTTILASNVSEIFKNTSPKNYLKHLVLNYWNHDLNGLTKSSWSLIDKENERYLNKIKYYMFKSYFNSCNVLVLILFEFLNFSNIFF